jgi:hypothetical protein
MGHVQGANRHEVLRFPERLDDDTADEAVSGAGRTPVWNDEAGVGSRLLSDAGAGESEGRVQCDGPGRQPAAGVEPRRDAAADSHPRLGRARSQLGHVGSVDTRRATWKA